MTTDSREIGIVLVMIRNRNIIPRYKFVKADYQCVGVAKTDRVPASLTFVL
jgi:hypothetical protein